MPFSVLAIYTTIIGIGIFLWVSATENYWESFCKPIFVVMDGTTRSARVFRALVLILLPILVGVLGFNSLKPDPIETPLQFRAYHPAPPPSITVYPPEHFIKDRSGK
jgi:hypothetical protein